MKPAAVTKKEAPGIERVKTPRHELASLRQERVDVGPRARGEMLDAMLACCGETGYRRVSVERVYRRYGGCKSQFYRYFESKSECYLAAYEAEWTRLCEMLLAAGEASCLQQLEAALGVLADFAIEHPLKARGLVVEVYVAGGDALTKRQKVIERLSHALDSACRETESRHSPPPTTAEFMTCAAEQALSSALVNNRPEGFAEAVPDLAALIYQAYHGDEPLR